MLPPEHIFQESDSYTCGPCCLAMVYKIKGKNITLQDILKDFKHPEKGKPTYVAQLAEHLEKNEVTTQMIVSSSRLVSPAWKNKSMSELTHTLMKWLELQKKAEWRKAVEYIVSYLKSGGQVVQDSYTAQTIKSMLDRGSLVILGIDEDWVWGHRLKLVGEKRIIDDLGGKVEGHFVLVKGHNNGKFHVLDPFPTNIEDRHGEYDVEENQLINASLTWDPEVLEILK